MSSAPLLQLLATQARLSDGELAERLDMTEEAVRAQREQWEREGLIVGYQAAVSYTHLCRNPSAACTRSVPAVPCTPPGPPGAGLPGIPRCRNPTAP